VRQHPLVISLAGLVAGGGFIVVLLPPAALPAGSDHVGTRLPTVRGAYHVHSQRSDGTGTLDDIAAAASEAGLDFVIVTDHGDGTRPFEPPAYRSGVLMLDGVEISTSGGHYVTLDVPQPPYRLAGPPRTVVEDVKRLGGFGVVAHPDSAKEELRWVAWDTDIDGLEWLNADSEWRDELWRSLGRGLLTYAFRPVETLATLLDRPEQTLRRWDHLARTRRIVGLAGADAHARLGYRQAVDPYKDRIIVRLPAYVSSFGTFQNHVVLDRALGGEPHEDAGTLLRAIRAGRVYTTIDGLAAAGAFDFRAQSGANRAEMGEYLDLDGTAAIEARVSAPPGTTLVLLRDGEPAYDTTEPTLRVDIGSHPGVYRVEARLPEISGRARVPWLVSNPIYVGLRNPHAAAATASLDPSPVASVRGAVDTSRWRAEVSPGSISEIELGPTGQSTPAIAWRFALATNAGPAPYAAAQFPLDGGASRFDRVLLVARSDRPMRLWAQLRSSASAERWGHTFYVDDAPRDIGLYFADFAPVGPTSTAAPPLDRVDSLLIVADWLNNRAGDRGEVHIRELALGR
jgi:hypothetical protein